MDHKSPQKDTSINTVQSSFIDYFQNWIGSRRSYGGRHQIIQRIEAIKIPHPRPVHKTNKDFRALIKQLPPREMAAIKKTPSMKKSSTVNPLSSCRSSNQSHKYGSRKLLNTKLRSSEEVATIDMETSALTLPPQISAAKSKTMLITPPIFTNSNTFDDLLTDEEDDIMEQMFLDKALRKVYNNRQTREKDEKKVTSKMKAVPPKVVKVMKEKPAMKSNTINSQSKAVQTKFTCNDNICGIIDTQTFNINCFYCYDIFAIKKWSLFINHVKRHHNLTQRTQKIANKLISSKTVHPKVSQEDVKLTGGKRQRQRTQIEAEDIGSMPPRKMKKSIVSDLNVKCINVEGDWKNVVNSSEMLSTTTPAPTKKFVKLMTPKRKQNVNKLPENLLPVKMRNTKVLKMPVKDSSDVTVQSATTNYTILPSPSTASTSTTNVSNTKDKVIKLCSNIKSIKNANTEAASKVATNVRSTELSSDKGTLKVNADKNVLTWNKSKEEDESTKPCFDNTNEKKPKTDASSTSSSPRSLISPIPYWNSEEEMISSDEHKDDYSGSTNVCDDSEATTKVVNLVTTTEPSLKSTEVHEADNKHIIKTTIEAMPPKVKSSAPSRALPFPSRYLDSEDEMPSNDEDEDAFPNSTNGCGILFGLTNSKIVSEFLRELEKYPELYKFNPNTKTTFNFDDSIEKLRTHINDTFNIDMTDFEIRLSIQRIKYWYCRTLQKMEYSKRTVSKKPFKHTFPEYFKIMDKFLSYDVSYTKDLVLGHRYQSDGVGEFQRYPTWMVCKPGTGPLIPNRNRPEVCDTPTPIMNVKSEDLEFGEDEMLTDSEEERPSDSPHTHSPPEPIICDICFVDFNRRIDLKRHRVVHFPPQHSCSTCKRMYYTRLMASKCSHVDTTVTKKKTINHIANDKKYMCEMCGASYRSVSTLNCHKRDKHFNMRHRCMICNFTCGTNYSLVQHQRKRHVVEFGTCEEIVKRTRLMAGPKVPYTGEARKEFEWLRDMRKLKKPGDIFYGCYKCKLIFTTRKDKMAHNRTEHPIRETTVVCLLCQHENALFANSCSVRRHYVDIHKVPWEEIDDLVHRTKPLYKLLTQHEINLLNNSDNHNLMLAQILGKKARAEQLGSSADESDDDEHYDLLDMANMNAVKSGRTQIMYHPSQYNDDDESNDDDLRQSTLYNDFEVSHDYDETHEFTDLEEYGEGAGDFEDLVLDSQPFNENDRELYLVEGNYGNDYYLMDVGQTPPVGAQQVVYGEDCMDDKISVEEIIVEEDFHDDAREGCY